MLHHNEEDYDKVKSYGFNAGVEEVLNEDLIQLLPGH